MLVLKRLIAIVFVLSSIDSGLAQSPLDWWYFGQNAGIHFTPSGPEGVFDGQLFTNEGCASISSSAGELLFYTDGSTVWDSTHSIMPNGTGLGGNPSSTQSAVIVPWPGSLSKYAIFTPKGCTGPVSLNPAERLFTYSVIDMSLNGGLGDVIATEKNIVLFDSTAEKCTAALHSNGIDIWVIGREQFDAEYHAYRLTPGGIVDTVTTQIGGTDVCIGYMLANHAGDRIADSQPPYGVLIYHFNQTTGELSSPDTIPSTYGLHFSPNDSLIYISGGSIRQYQIYASNVAATEITVSPSPIPTQAIAEGPDGKLYMARTGGTYLSSIENPNVVGVGCNFLDSAVSIAPNISIAGLPNHVGAGILSLSPIVVEGHCLGDEVTFTVDSLSRDSILWKFDDPASGSANSSTWFSAKHLYSDSGSYVVTAVVYTDTLIDTLETMLFIYPRQSVQLGPDSTLCFGDTVVLNISQPYSTFLWSDSSADSAYAVTNADTVWATVFGICDTVSDTIVFQINHPLSLELGSDTTLCGIEEWVLNQTIDSTASIVWNTGDTIDSLIISQTGEYVLTLSNACGTVSDSTVISFIPYPDSVLLPPDSVYCGDSIISLKRPVNDLISWLWSDSSTTKTIKIQRSDTIWLNAFNECGSTTDTFSVLFNGVATTELGNDTVICPSASIQLFGTDSAAAYEWSTGESTDTILVEAGSIENYQVTITLGDCQFVESIRVIGDDTACVVDSCHIRFDNIFTPNADGKNDIFRVHGGCDYIRSTLSVYNRWGQLVYHSSNASYGWDGYISGVLASQGTYYYVFVYEDQDGQTAQHKGSLTLITD